MSTCLLNRYVSINRWNILGREISILDALNERNAPHMILIFSTLLLFKWISLSCLCLSYMRHALICRSFLFNIFEFYIIVYKIRRIDNFLIQFNQFHLFNVCYIRLSIHLLFFFIWDCRLDLYRIVFLACYSNIWRWL